MIKSMTAYSRAERQVLPLTSRVEIRTYNNRHLDVALKLSHGFEALEERIKARIAETVARGRVEIRVTLQDDSESGVQFAVDRPRIRAYHQALMEVGTILENPTAPISLETILAAGNMIQSLDGEKDTDAAWECLSPCLSTALAQLDAMRLAEGKNLAEDFTKRLGEIERFLDEIEAEAGGIPEMIRQRLVERIETLTRGIVELDPVRIAQEAALLADRSDISEEIVRARSHIQQFRSLMTDDAPAGRPLNFLLQEFNREFNTMGSKAGKAGLAHKIVAVKSELEKLREQIQNIE
ncbi:YicC family protein [Desulfosarcina sp. OttesenSCG-928-G17]|nr:YicC family protein [Desulfosarcina sp. OttesenSCG-928-G17]